MRILCAGQRPCGVHWEGEISMLSFGNDADLDTCGTGLYRAEEVCRRSIPVSGFVQDRARGYGAFGETASQKHETQPRGLGVHKFNSISSIAN